MLFYTRWKFVGVHFYS